MFSIIVPTYNNLEYLKLSLKSIEKNSSLSHEIIIFVNDGSDGTLDYLKTQNYKFKQSKKMLECIFLMKLLNKLLPNILFWLTMTCIFVQMG